MILGQELLRKKKKKVLLNDEVLRAAQTLVKSSDGHKLTVTGFTVPVCGHYWSIDLMKTTGNYDCKHCQIMIDDLNKAKP